MNTQTTGSISRSVPVVCAACGEQWDEDGLRDEAVEYLDGVEDSLLAPLGESVVAAFSSYWNVTVVAAFSSWRAAAAADAAAAAAEVNAAVYEATVAGKGCPACGWAHTWGTDEDPVRVLAAA
jgi:hypothetical protein